MCHAYVNLAVRARAIGVYACERDRMPEIERVRECGLKSFLSIHKVHHFRILFSIYEVILQIL